MDPEFRIQTEAVAQILDELDYFQILKIEQSASPLDVKNAYYRESRTYHPDRYFTLPDVAMRDSIGRIYRRINEAYVVLRDDSKRAKYMTDINGPERRTKLRYTEASEQEQKRAQEVGTTPQGKKFFQAGQTDMQAGRFSAAERNFKMALTYEKDNPNYKAALDASNKAQRDAAKK